MVAVVKQVHSDQEHSSLNQGYLDSYVAQLSKVVPTIEAGLKAFKEGTEQQQKTYRDVARLAEVGENTFLKPDELLAAVAARVNGVMRDLVVDASASAMHQIELLKSDCDPAQFQFASKRLAAMVAADPLDSTVHKSKAVSTTRQAERVTATNCFAGFRLFAARFTRSRRNARDQKALELVARESKLSM